MAMPTNPLASRLMDCNTHAQLVQEAKAAVSAELAALTARTRDR